MLWIFSGVKTSLDCSSKRWYSSTQTQCKTLRSLFSSTQRYPMHHSKFVRLNEPRNWFWFSNTIFFDQVLWVGASSYILGHFLGVAYSATCLVILTTNWFLLTSTKFGTWRTISNQFNFDNLKRQNTTMKWREESSVRANFSFENVGHAWMHAWRFP